MSLTIKIFIISLTNCINLSMSESFIACTWSRLHSATNQHKKINMKLSNDVIHVPVACTLV